MDNTIKHIANWFKAAVPEPTIKNFYTQLGCHFEEISEMVQAIQSDDICVYNELVSVADELKSLDIGDGKEAKEFIDNINHRAFLDSLCDQIVTAIGIAHMMGYNIDGALKEVNTSNWSKFENGVPVFDENGKIAKGKHYTPPCIIAHIGDR